MVCRGDEVKIVVGSRRPATALASIIGAQGVVEGLKTILPGGEPMVAVLFTDNKGDYGLFLFEDEVEQVRTSLDSAFRRYVVSMQDIFVAHESSDGPMIWSGTAAAAYGLSPINPIRFIREGSIIDSIIDGGSESDHRLAEEAGND